MFGILVALLSGALMSLQGIFNTEVTKQSSIWAAAGWVQLTAFLTCVLLYSSDCGNSDSGFLSGGAFWPVWRGTGRF